MLTFGLTKKSNRMNPHSMENNMAHRNNYIEYISKSFENKEYVKLKVVLLKYCVDFFLSFSLRKLRIQGRFAESTQPKLGSVPDIENKRSALGAITAIAQWQMKNTRSDRFKP